MTASSGVDTFVAADGATELPLHVVMPAGPVRGALLLFHGGGWHIGSPEVQLPLAHAFADAGICAGSAGYRLMGQGARSPADCLADAARAAR